MPVAGNDPRVRGGEALQANDSLAPQVGGSDVRPTKGDEAPNPIQTLAMQIERASAPRVNMSETPRAF